jgi:protein-disulfide isomerase
MKLITSLALLVAVSACEQPSSRLDKITTDKPSAHAAAAPGAAPSGAPSAGKIDRSGSVEQQLARLQDAYDRNVDGMTFVNEVLGQQKQQREAQEREEPAPDAMFAVNVDGDIKLGQVDGPASASVTIVKAFDFACPYCMQASPTMKQLVKDYGGKVRVVYANLVVHASAKPAHLASCAAAKQGKYDAFKDAFWEKGFAPYAASQGKDAAALGEDNIMAIAKGLGLDTDKLKADMHSPACEAHLQADQQEFSKFRVGSTPTFFVNGKHVSGAQPLERFKVIIDEQLKLVEKSGVAGGDYYEKVVLAKGEKQFRSKLDPKPN